MINPEEIEGVVAIPGIPNPSDQMNIKLHYEHLNAVLLYNILLELRTQRVLLEEISEGILPD